MRIPKINEIFERFAKSKTGTKIYKWCSDSKKREDMLNIVIPSAETVVSTASYVIAVESQPKDKVDRQRKDLLHFQNVSSGIIGLGLGMIANKWVYKKGEEIIKDLDIKKIDPKSIRQISTGIRVIGPAIITASIMRFALPTITAYASGKYTEHKRNNNEYNSSKINIKA